MKSFISYCIIAIMACGSVLPVAAQRKAHGFEKKRPFDTVHSEQTVTTAFGKINAISDGTTGVIVKWTMASERGSFAFDVFRLDADGKHFVGGESIGGSGLTSGNEPVFGQEYSVYDPDGHPGATYAIENTSADGVVRRSETVGVTFEEDISFEASELIRQIESRRISGSLRQDDLILDKELSSRVESGRLIDDPVTHKWVITQPGVKIGVNKEGMYRVTRAELQAGGFNVDADSANWQLYDRGVQQSLIVGPNGDYIEFYGRGIDTPESDTRAYFLINGPSAGKRMATRVSRPSTNTVVAPSYSQSFVLKERTNYVNTIRNGDAENFWGRLITTSATNLNFTLSGVDLDRPTALLTVKLHGMSTGLHQVNLSLNGQSLTPVNSAGQVAFTTTQVVPTTSLVNGTNVLQMQSAGPSGDSSLFDSIEIVFDRQHIADQNNLFFTSQNDRKARATGFSSPSIRLIDNTLENDPIEVTNLAVTDAGGSFTLEFPAQRAARVYAYTDSSLLGASSINPIGPDQLGLPTNAADFVIIAYKDFVAEAQLWANYRQGQGITVKVVDVDDVFEEFNYGVSSAESIKSFLAYAHSNWTNGPDYVLLLGDGTIDPRNYYGIGRFNLVPSKIVNTVMTETASDEYLSDLNGDGLAEMAIGRVPARTADRVAIVREKTVRFETMLNDPVAQGVLLAYDNPNGYPFEEMSQRLRQQLPADWPTTMVGVGQPDSLATLVAAMNTGKYIANFSGHGTTGVWAGSNWFTLSNVFCTGGAVHCINHPMNETIFTMLTCLNGYFISPSGSSLSEALLFSTNGGAVATWASTGLTTPDVQEGMGQRFYQQIGLGNIPRLGDLVKDAKTAIPGGTDVRLSWVLLGDPMLKVRQTPSFK